MNKPDILISDLIELSDYFSTKNPNNLNAIFDKINEKIPNSNVLICKVYSSPKFANRHFRVQYYGSFNIDDNFFASYCSLKMNEIDPIIKYTYNSATPITWSDALKSEFKSTKFTKYLKKFKLHNGLAYMYNDSDTKWSTYFCLGHDNIQPIHYLFVSYIVPYIHKIIKSNSIKNLVVS